MFAARLKTFCLWDLGSQFFSMINLHSFKSADVPSSCGCMLRFDVKKLLQPFWNDDFCLVLLFPVDALRLKLITFFLKVFEIMAHIFIFPGEQFIIQFHLVILFIFLFELLLRHDDLFLIWCQLILRLIIKILNLLWEDLLGVHIDFQFLDVQKSWRVLDSCILKCVLRLEVFFLCLG